MEKVSGIDGFFFRSHNPAAASEWYRDILGVALAPANYGESPWWQEAGPVFAAFPETTAHLNDSGNPWDDQFSREERRGNAGATASRGHLC